MEVILIKEAGYKPLICILHVCGGDPFPTPCFPSELSYSPRMWRWSCSSITSIFSDVVFSTYVEVILSTSTSSVVQLGILHVCGGDPGRLQVSTSIDEYSPRMWRWSWIHEKIKQYFAVFSTYVEVILGSFTLEDLMNSILHVCGGDPFDPSFGCT